VTGRQGRRRRKLLDDLKERRWYSDLKKEALDRTMWRAGFGRGFGPVVRQTAKWNELHVLVFGCTYKLSVCRIEQSWAVNWFLDSWTNLYQPQAKRTGCGNIMKLVFSYYNLFLPTYSGCRGFLLYLITLTVTNTYGRSLWTSDQAVGKISAWQYTTLTADTHPCSWRESNLQSQQTSGRRPPALPQRWFVLTKCAL
jgi:hypothetical protein